MSVGSVLGKAGAGAADAVAVSAGIRELNDQVQGQQAMDKFHNNGVKAAVDSIT